MTLIRELIPIPERVQRGDFVLNLATGLSPEAVEQTLGQYVVTSQLARAFEDALGFIRSAIDSSHPRSKGAYLHGSFGSGKSHFMAVLHLLLQGHPQARGIPELARAVATHDDWLQSRNILLVPYHMIGAATVETGVLGSYARHIRRLHPDAPEPGFYISGQLFADAQKSRQHMGDEQFFAALNAGSAGHDDDWGDVAAGWDAASFEAVVHGQAADTERSRLVGDLVGTLFTSYRQLANTGDGGFLDFDEGLQVMTQHARALGYDAVTLFLDELILWLASHLSDQRFVQREIQKVVKLVESGAPRALPLVSFIARQRDLREFVGEQYSGVDQEILSDSLKYWEGRFHTITLEDRNLPVIAERRLLRPRDDAARAQIDAAFEQTASMRAETFDILLTREGDREMFRRLYPFSPALIQALVALSSALQRERTSLKVMLLLLVEQRETLELGQLIPAGDLYDVIASEAEPFSEQMRNHFDHGRLLLERKLIPLLEGEHRVESRELEAASHDDPAASAFRNDLRLMKTLLLAALVPEVESFKNLTAARLAALNHGTIRSPIPGREAQTVLQKCRKWAGQVGEIKISDDADPLLSVQLSGVDTESILDQARINDNEGNRRRLIKELVFEAIGIRDDNEMFIEHAWPWRGTRRRAEVLFQNIREISDLTTFEARGDDWKVIIDFPFDSDGYSPTDDQARVREYEEQGESTQTLCWLPYFFSPTMLKNLGKLVILEDVLRSDDRFSQYSRHLQPQDRAQARTLLVNQRSQLRQQIRDALLGAYGVSEPIPGTIDDTGHVESQIMSLQPGFAPRLPAGTTLAKGFEQLLGQALAFQYPDHPEFDTDLKQGDLGKVLGELRRALLAENGRIDVDAPLRPLMRQIAQPLQLGEMHERHFIFKPEWPQRLSRALAEQGGPVTVADLRAAMDKPRARGLPEMVQNLLVLIFAEHGQYAFTLHNGPFDDVSLKEIRDDLVLIPQKLAEPQLWKQGLEVAQHLFGAEEVGRHRTATNQAALQQRVQGAVAERLAPCRELSEVLHRNLTRLGESGGSRLANAEHAVEVLESLQGQTGPDLVARLAEVKQTTSFQALSRSMESAARVRDALADNNWELLETVWSGPEPEAARLRKRVVDALKNDELVTPLAPALRQAQADVTRIVRERMGVDPGPPEPPPLAPQPPKGRKILRQESRRGLNAGEARSLMTQLGKELRDGMQVDLTYIVTGEDED